MSTFEARHATFSGSIEVAGDLERVFRLFSPVGEKDWVPGWDPELLHPPGVEWAEEMLFRTREEAGDAVWIVSRLDRQAHRVTYHRVEPERYVARVEAACRPLAGGRVEAIVSYSFVGLSTRGNRDIAAMTVGDYQEKMARWSRWIGDCLEAEARRGG